MFNMCKMTGVNGAAGFAHPSRFAEVTSVFSVICVVQSLALCVVPCEQSFDFLSFFVLPFYCLSFDLRFLITPFISSSFSCNVLPEDKSSLHFKWFIGRILN